MTALTCVASKKCSETSNQVLHSSFRALHFLLSVLEGPISFHTLTRNVSDPGPNLHSLHRGSHGALPEMSSHVLSFAETGGPLALSSTVSGSTITMVLDTTCTLCIPPGYEADDVIAAIARRAGPDEALGVSILSSDMDLWQLLGEGGEAGAAVEVLLPGGTKGGLERITSDTVRKRLGVEPGQVRGQGGTQGFHKEGVGVSGVIQLNMNRSTSTPGTCHIRSSWL